MVTQEELEKMSPEEISQLQKDNCIFCKIIRGEIPSKKVYEDDDVLAILDINPARSGHVLVMPKEHFPILPLIPPDKFEKLFSVTGLITQGIRKAMLVKETTIFIANGAVAGQQSPHFLFHIFPRDEGDGLTNFDLQENVAIKEEQKSLEEPLKNNLNIMLSKIVPSIKQENKPSEKIDDEGVKKREMIAQILEEHEDVRNALIENPDSFREELKGNYKLEELFKGVDLKTLSEKLKLSFTPSKKEEVVIPKETKKPEEEKSPSEDEVPETNKRPEVFLGADPVAQRTEVFKYFESKPKAKQLLIDDPKYFEELLDKRPDVRDLFMNVNLELLSKKLKEREEESK